MITNDLLTLLTARDHKARPLHVGLIGAGKFGAMFLSQARRVPGLHVVAVADLSLERARTSLQRTGWPEDQFSAEGFDEALKTGATHITDDGERLVTAPQVDVVVEATCVPSAGIQHALGAI